MGGIIPFQSSNGIKSKFFLAGICFFSAPHRTAAVKRVGNPSIYSGYGIFTAVMALSRAGYRLKQMRSALWARPSEEGIADTLQILSEEQFELFKMMQPSEQVHALAVFDQLQAQGFQDPDLLLAALLHDVGKARFPLHPWDRAFVVLGKRFFPEKAKRWGSGQPKNWRKSFVVAAQHPNWGAAMAEACGAPVQAVTLIQRHQETIQTDNMDEETRLLAVLQAADDQN